MTCIPKGKWKRTQGGEANFTASKVRVLWKEVLPRDDVRGLAELYIKAFLEAYNERSAVKSKVLSIM